MSFAFHKTDIPGVYLITPKVYTDDRGCFKETYVRPEFVKQGIDENFVQNNQSWSQAGVFRGMHIQVSPYAQSKLIDVVRGRVLDVVVDVRPKSPAFKKVQVFELADMKPDMLYIPTGCLHGFLALCDNTVFNYQVGAFYNIESAYTVNWLDPTLNIKPRLSKRLAQMHFDKTILDNVILSEQDKNAMTFATFMTKCKPKLRHEYQ